MLPLFENDILSRKLSSSKLSVGIGVVIGEKSSVETDVNLFVGVPGLLLFLEPGILHLRRLSELRLPLPLFLCFGVVGACAGSRVGVWGALGTFVSE
jgi:hypothetical protein